MGGVLSHVLLGLISGGILWYVWKKPEFFFAALVGNTIVDGFRLVISGILQKNWNLFSVEHDAVFHLIGNATNSFANWFALGFFITSLLAFLYHHHFIRKKTMFEYDEIVWAFLIGVVLHLILDLVYHEISPWI